MQRLSVFLVFVINMVEVSLRIVPKLLIGIVRQQIKAMLQLSLVLVVVMKGVNVSRKIYPKL